MTHYPAFWVTVFVLLAVAIFAVYYSIRRRAAARVTVPTKNGDSTGSAANSGADQ